MKRSAIGWIVIAVIALTWEMLGIFGVGDIWPLTSLVRDADAHSEVAVLITFLAVVGFPAWLVYHFFGERNPFKR